ncbi:MAG: hypothetical protein DMF88_08015 [Acidobacteria bacterium]|nr:MAG: hypothetical protein DMF88_08015 [Acidobacteriota bacterium]
MTAGDFRRGALSLEGAEEGSHMGAVDFRVGGRIFATLASVKQGFGNLMLTPDMQADFVADAPDVFLPVAGGWPDGCHSYPPRKANRDILTGALRTAWQLRVDKNAASEEDQTRAARAQLVALDDPGVADEALVVLREQQRFVRVAEGDAPVTNRHVVPHDDDADIEVVPPLNADRHPHGYRPADATLDAQHVVARRIHPDAPSRHDVSGPVEAVVVPARVFDQLEVAPAIH